MTDRSRVKGAPDLQETIARAIHSERYYRFEPRPPRWEDLTPQIRDQLLREADGILAVLNPRSGWFCLTHSQWNWNPGYCWVYDMGDKDCQAVPGWVAVLTEEETE